MSLWSKAKKAVRKAAKKVAQAAKTVVNTVTEVAADVVEMTGNAVESGLNKLADAAERNIPGVGGAISSVARYAGRAFAGATDMAAAAVKTSGNLLGATIAGAVLIGVGIATFDGPLIGEGFAGITAALAGGILLFGGKALAGLSALFPGVDQRQPLSEAQKKLLRRVFNDSLALHNIRLMKTKWGAGLLTYGDRPFTLGNVIYLKGRNVDKEPELLVHECTHVWQYQNLGAQYSSEAVHAQWFVPDPYNWEREIRRGNDKWHLLNREAQAKLLENIYTNGELIHIPQPWIFVNKRQFGKTASSGGAYTTVSTGPVTPMPMTAPARETGDGVFYDADPPNSVGVFEFNSEDARNPIDYTALANDAVAAVRGATNMRLSGALDE
jgi:hypothetical protein